MLVTELPYDQKTTYIIREKNLNVNNLHSKSQISHSLKELYYAKGILIFRNLLLLHNYDVFANSGTYLSS